MNDYSLNQAKDLIQTLRKSYSTVRVRDAKSRKIIYDELVADSMENAQQESLNITGMTLFLDINSQSIEAPINIDGQPCILEIIQPHLSGNDKALMQNLREQIFIDSLTNLYNRRFIDEQIPIDLKRAFRYGEPVSFIYTDIDSFKSVNDQYGHVVGDQVLSEMADLFQGIFRRKDGWLARYGGDEFLFCLPEIDKNTAVQIAKRLRNAVMAKEYRSARCSINVTCSFGIQTIDRSCNVQTVNDVIELLDIKLYQAKQRGKNRIIS